VGHTDSLSFVAWSPDDSQLLTCGNDRLLKLWQATALSPRLAKHWCNPMPQVSAPHRCQVSTGECVRTFSKHTDNVTACAWLPDGAGLESSCAPCLHLSLVPG